MNHIYMLSDLKSPEIFSGIKNIELMLVNNVILNLLGDFYPILATAVVELTF